MLTIIKNSALNSFELIKKKALLLVLVQLPVGLLVILQSWLEPHLESSPILALMILLPLFSFASSFCTALTYLVSQADSFEQNSQSQHLKEKLGDKFKPLATSSLIVAIFFGLGLAALVLPGIYFLATYIFVPILVVSEPKGSTSQYLFESKKIVTQNKNTLLLTIGIVLSSFLIEIPISQMVSILASYTGGALVIDALLSMIFGAIFDCFIVSYFLTLKQKENA